MKTKDWRANIKGINDLNDLDPVEMMVFLRHTFLGAAKELRKHTLCPDIEKAAAAVSVAEALQKALELDTEYPYLNNSSYFQS